MQEALIARLGGLQQPQTPHAYRPARSSRPGRERWQLIRMCVMSLLWGCKTIKPSELARAGKNTDARKRYPPAVTAVCPSAVALTAQVRTSLPAATKPGTAVSHTLSPWTLAPRRAHGTHVKQASYRACAAGLQWPLAAREPAPPRPSPCSPESHQKDTISCSRWFLSEASQSCLGW